VAVGTPDSTEAAKLFCGMIAVDEAVLQEAERLLAARFGPIELRSPVIPFSFTDYYRAEMGEALLRRFVSFEGAMDPGRLAAVKTDTNRIEKKMAVHDAGITRRRVNLDPGYVTAAKVVLATTKNNAHRIYLGDGIYAEITVGLCRKGPRCHEWTYPDYRTETYGRFFMDVRRALLAAGHED